MKKSTLAAVGVVAAVSVAAAAGMVAGAKGGKIVRRAADNVAETMEETGKKISRIVRKMR